MRRIILHIVSFLILLASTGLKLQAHYCHGHFAGIKFVYNSCCCDEKKADCCEDKVIEVEKSEFEYTPEQAPQSNLKLYSANVNAQLTGTSKEIHTKRTYQKIKRTDPPERKISLFLFYQRLLHYG